MGSMDDIFLPPAEKDDYNPGTVDPVDEAIAQGSSNNPKQVLEWVTHDKVQVDLAYLRLGRNLFLIEHNKWYVGYGFSTYGRFLTEHLGMSPKRAQRLKRVWKQLVRVVGVRHDELVGLGYSKASLLATLVNGKAGQLLDRKNASSWIGDAKSMSYGALEKHISEVKAIRMGSVAKSDPVVKVPDPMDYEEEPQESKWEDDPTAPPKKPQRRRDLEVEVIDVEPKKRSFFLFPGQEDILDEALLEAGRMGNTDKPGAQLEYVAQGYLSNRMGEKEPGDGRPRFWMNIFEKMFGGRLVWVKDDEAAEVVDGLLKDHPDLLSEKN